MIGFPKKKKLTLDEIEQARDRILKKYDFYIIEFMKPAKIRDQFRVRYLDALRARMDMENFLFAEMTVVDDLINQEKQRKESEAKAKEKKKSKKETATMLAEKVIQENQRRIAHYPEFELHPDANKEVEKLASVMQQIDEIFWPQIEKIMRKSSPTLYGNARVVLEQKLYELCNSNLQGEINRLTSYVSALGRFPREYRTIEREEQRYILEVAHLLHIFAGELENFQNSDMVEEDDKDFVETVLKFVHTIIQDFRLGDFKPNY